MSCLSGAVFISNTMFLNAKHTFVRYLFVEAKLTESRNVVEC